MHLHFSEHRSMCCFFQTRNFVPAYLASFPASPGNCNPSSQHPVQRLRHNDHNQAENTTGNTAECQRFWEKPFPASTCRPLPWSSHVAALRAPVLRCSSGAVLSTGHCIASAPLESYRVVTPQLLVHTSEMPAHSFQSLARAGVFFSFCQQH